MAVEYISTKVVESKTIPGVKFVLHRMTEGRRLNLRKMLAEPNSRLNNMTKDMHLLEKASEEDRDFTKIMEIANQMDDILLEQLNPAWMRWGLKAIDGLQIDGQILTHEDFMNFPSELYEEILEAIRAEANLSSADAKNSESPTTSGEQEPGRRSNSTAANADIVDISGAAIVPGTSLN